MTAVRADAMIETASGLFIECSRLAWGTLDVGQRREIGHVERLKLRLASRGSRWGGVLQHLPLRECSNPAVLFA